MQLGRRSSLQRYYGYGVRVVQQFSCSLWHMSNP